MERKKFQIGLLTILILFHLIGLENVSASANKFEALHIHAFLNADGSATITERRVGNYAEGTEHFIVIGNLGKSTIKDFTVWENGEPFEYVDNWDIDASREEKAFKNGIIETDDGYELSWGIGEYGRHEYIVQYTVTNFVKQLQDSQIVFWRFVNDQMTPPPEEVTVEIESDHRFSDVNEKIWAFGFTGYIQFQEGKVFSYSTEPLNENNYVTILVKLKDGMFQTEDVIDQPFEDIQEQAFEGSDYGKEATGGLSGSSKVQNTLIVLFVIYLLFIMFFKSTKKLTKKRPRKFKRKYHGEYYRDDPYDGDYLDIYYILYVMGASNFEKLLTGFILKWVKEERVHVETEPSTSFFKKDSAIIYIYNKDLDEKSTLEGELFHMMVAAAGSNDILEQKEFTKWAKVNYKKLIDWEKRAIKLSIQKLEDLGYIELREKKKWLLFTTEDYELTEAGQELEDHIYQYVNYLHDFSLLNEHEAVNVKIWDEIMIWAAFLGLTDVVREQFRALYPRYEQETVYSDESLRSSHSFSHSASSVRTSSSSGGGGASSSGGGGGSFGGGSGGGTR